MLTSTPYSRGLFERHVDNPIIRARDLPYRCNTVFNAAAAMVNGETVLLMRVEDMRGHSHLTVARSKDGVTNWQIDPQPTFVADPDHYPEEIWGIEDPRVTYLEEQDRWAITYTAYSVGGPLVSLATTRDFKTFTRLGPVMPPDDKDAALFPIRFNGRWAMLHRPMPAASTSTGGAGAHIWLSWSPDLKHWGDHHILLRARRGGWWDANKIGLSPPPLRTEEGWLLLYHGVRLTASGAIYRLGLALVDLNDPTKVVARSDEWVFEPEAEYERFGDVDKVVFPCGWIEQNGEVRIYYGAADSRLAIATAKVADLLDWLKQTSGRMRRDDIV
jgi:predicted GH43/DUF377 family glycosyl hydrolase